MIIANKQNMQLPEKGSLILYFFLLIAFGACRSESKRTDPPLFAQARAESAAAIDNPELSAESDTLLFDHITLEDGLSQSTTNSIVQDRQGYIWFGTSNGLNRYDGYEITVFKHVPSDANSLSDNIIRALLVDSSGILWIGTEGGGLEEYDQALERFIHHRHDADDPASLSSDIIYELHEDRFGTLWIGTPTGLNRLDRETREFTRYPNDLDTFGDPATSNIVLAIQDDPDGNIWLGTAWGLLIFDPANESFSAAPLESEYSRNVISCFYLDMEGNLWIGSLNDGAYLYHPETGEVSHFHYSPVKLDSLANNVVRDIVADKGGNVWVATEAGINRRIPGTSGFIYEQHDPNRPSSLSDNTVTTLFIDDAEILWAGTFTGGVNKFDPYKIKFQHDGGGQENPESSLSDSLVLSFLEDSQGDLWIGTFSGLNRLNEEDGNIVHYSADRGDPRTIADGVISAILEDQNGNLWFATYGGLSRFNREAGEFTSYRHNPYDSESLGSSILLTLYEDRRGDLWIGTAGAGFDRFDPARESFTHFQFDGSDPVDNPGRGNIRDFLEDSAGTFWVGTLAGLGKFDREGGKISYYVHDPQDPDSLSDNYVLTIHEDVSGRLWVGTQNGLNLFNPGDETFERYLWEEGLPDNVIYGILEDDRENLWLSTNRGISQFNPRTQTFRNYDTGDGLQALEFNIGAYYENRRGEMYFGGINGFNKFHPQDIRDNPYIPPVIVTKFQIMNQEIAPGKDAHLPKAISLMDAIGLGRDDSSISLELAAMHFSSPEENQYAYIMEGFDADWNYIGNRHFATYTNLPPGEYTFRAIGSNSDGIWNLEGTSIKVSVAYPFWRKWWFLLIVALILAASVYVAYRLRTRTIELRTHELEVQVASRTTEIEQRREIAEGLREILVILNSSQSLEESLHYIVDQAARLTEAEDAIIFRLDDQDQITIVATNQGGQIRYKPGSDLLAITSDWREKEISQRTPLIVPDSTLFWAEHREIQPVTLATHRAMLGLPLTLGDEIYGGLLMFYTDVRSFDADDLELGSTFADQAALAIANDRLREQAEETAIASERNRLARDLHDAVTQTLFSASLIAETLPLIYDNNEAEGRKLLFELRQLTRGALAEMRTLLLELRPAALQESELPDLLFQLTEAVEGRTGIPIKTSIERPCRLPVQVRIALYRIAQESLNNVMKHARATEIEVSLNNCSDGRSVQLSVSDNGRGFDVDHVASDRMGLKIIRERAQAVGAELLITSKVNHGSEVTVIWEEDEG